jgi:hypothetical protein
VFLGKIVKSYSHIHYVCQIDGPLEVDAPPDPSDYAFGRFARVALRSGNQSEVALRKETAPGSNDEPPGYVVGVIYDTTLLNPEFGTLGPRLSNDTQVALFSPDYLSEKAELNQ